MSLEKIFERYAAVINGNAPPPSAPRYKSYAVSNLRGGVGKTSLTFNLAYELSVNHRVLVADLCPQCNLTETFFRGHEDPEVTILDALKPIVSGPAFGTAPDDLGYRISQLRNEFKATKPSFIVPGDPELFAFPSTLYQQLQQAKDPGPVTALLNSLKTILTKQAENQNCDITLMDTSPFYAGGTHLAWVAADALIIPVKVDEHSVASLELILKMLSDANQDFGYWNKRSTGITAPRVAAVVMTMAGARSNTAGTPDRASMMYIKRAYEFASHYRHLFDHADLSDAIIITDDMSSGGRISGSESIPLSKLVVGKFHTIGGKRIQVNASVEKYTNQLRYLAGAI
jgi:cellulose biosynthesis protein BcsQ